MIFCLQINIKLTYKLIPLILVGIARKVSNSFKILKLNWVMKFMFCMLINIKVFYKFIVLLLICPVRSAMFLSHLKQEVKNEVRHLIHWLVQILLLQFFIHPVFSLYWPFSFPQYGIYAKPFFHLIKCSCNISSLLF